MKTLKITIVLCFWNSVLVKFQILSAQLQASSVHLSKILLFETLHGYVDTLLDEKEFSLNQKLSRDAKWPHTQKMWEEDRNQNFILMRIKLSTLGWKGDDLSFLIIIMQLFIFLKLEKPALFIIQQTKSLFFSWKLHELNDSEFITSKVQELKRLYATDVEETSEEECVNLVQISTADTEAQHSIYARTLKGLLHLMKRFSIECIFLNVETILRMFWQRVLLTAAAEGPFKHSKE